MKKTKFNNLLEFFDDNPERATSPVVDYGLSWKHAPYFCRISYLRDTGEIYAIQQTMNIFHSSQVWILGVVPPDDGEIYYRTLNEILKGWTNQMTSSSGITWVMDRIKSWNRIRKIQSL